MLSSKHIVSVVINISSNQCSVPLFGVCRTYHNESGSAHASVMRDKTPHARSRNSVIDQNPDLAGGGYIAQVKCVIRYQVPTVLPFDPLPSTRPDFVYIRYVLSYITRCLLIGSFDRSGDQHPKDEFFKWDRIQLSRCRDDRNCVLGVM